MLKGWKGTCSPVKGCGLGGAAREKGELTCASVGLYLCPFVTLVEDSKELPCGSHARLFPRHLNRNITCLVRK